MRYDNLTEILLEQFNGYKPIKLPYSFDSLEPHIDAETMKLHYNKHYKGYIKKLNDAVNNSDTPLNELVKKAGSKKDSIRNNAGGAYNHQLFWNMMTPEKTTLKGNLRDMIIKKYKSVDNFYTEFTD